MGSDIWLKFLLTHCSEKSPKVEYDEVGQVLPPSALQLAASDIEHDPCGNHAFWPEACGLYSGCDGHIFGGGKNAAGSCTVWCQHRLKDPTWLKPLEPSMMACLVIMFWCWHIKPYRLLYLFAAATQFDYLFICIKGQSFAAFSSGIVESLNAQLH